MNASESSFSGKEHFIRRRRSPKPGHPPRPQGPEEHCKVVAGELGVAPESSLAILLVFCDSGGWAAGAGEGWQV